MFQSLAFVAIQSKWEQCVPRELLRASCGCGDSDGTCRALVFRRGEAMLAVLAVLAAQLKVVTVCISGAGSDPGTVLVQGARQVCSATIPTLQHAREFWLISLQSHKAEMAKETQRFSSSITPAWLS